MKIIKDLAHKNAFKNPISLTIGHFDGVHLGHEFLLTHVKNAAKKKDGQSIVVTFENHPKSVVASDQQPDSICTLSHKIKLLEQIGIDGLVLLEFTKDFSEQTADMFLKRLHEAIPFSLLILGHDSMLGKNRHGAKEHILTLAKDLNFEVEYLKPLTIQHHTVSSTLIRSKIQKGDFSEAETLLGRKYSIQNQVVKGMGKGKELGFPTANLDLKGLCLPPFGVYAVLVQYDNKQEKAVANLGLAPTIRHDKIPVLEFHLLESQEQLYGKEINVTFCKFIRPEMRFENIEELKKQIHQDIETAKSILK